MFDLINFSALSGNTKHLATGLGLLILVVIFFALYRARVSDGRLPIFLRLFALAALILAILDPSIKSYQPATDRIAIFADISDSMDYRSAEELLGQHGKKFSRISIDEIIPFAAKTFGSQNFTNNYYGLTRNRDEGSLQETDLLEAIATAKSNGSNRILLLSDGYDTRNSSQSIIETVKRSGIRVFPLYNNKLEFFEPNLGIARLSSPLFVKAQSSVEIGAVISNTFSNQEKGRLIITQDQKTILDQEIAVKPFEEKYISTKSDPDINGIQEIRARFIPSNPKGKETQQIIYLTGEKREKILLLSGDQSDEKYLSKVFERASYQVEYSFPKNEAAADPLAGFSTVIINNAHYNQLPAVVQSNLESFVKKGGGFMMIGGNKTFGLGGYIGTKIEDIIPLDLIPPQTVQKRLNVAVQLVLDKSRSMADGDRIYYAREAAKEVVRNLKDDDYLGVIGFDSNPFIVQRIEQLADIRYSVMERIDRLYPARRTNLLPAIDEARRGLERVTAGRKHMIILTDGQIPDSSPLYLELVQQLKATGITVSTVLLSDEMDDRLLEQMASRGGGSFYKTSDPTSLPRIFMKDVKVNTGERTMQESELSFSVGIGEGKLTSTQSRSYNNLYGFVETKRRSDSNIELVVNKDGKKFPLLASMKIGSGRSVAFTSDANGRWSQGWVPAYYFIPFWTQVIDSLREKPHGESSGGKKIDFDIKYVFENGEAKFDLSVFSENINDLPGGTLTAAVSSGAKQPAPTSLDCSKEASGHFICSGKKPSPGKNIVKINFGDQQLPELAVNIPDQPVKEIKGKGFNTPFLEELANVSGGKCNPEEKDLIVKSNNVEGASKSLVPYLFLIALISYLCEVFVRAYSKNSRVVP